MVTLGVPVSSLKSCTTQDQMTIDKRVSEVENSIIEIKKVLEGLVVSQPVGGSPSPNGLAEIRTQDLRHVKATS